MSFTSLQVCMDSVDWLQGTIHEESGLDSSSPSRDMLTCTGPLIERRLRPQHEQALKCPRCDSTHTKFCYYNNYSLSQPRYFCKTCRRYWTKGGTLRNIPVGGGCRKNKKVSNKKGSDQPTINNQNLITSTPSSSATMVSHNPTDLQLSFPEVQLSHLNSIMASQGILANPTSYMDNKYTMSGPENASSSRHIEFMESKWEAIVGSSRNINNYDFMGDGHDHLGMVNGLGGHHLGHNVLSPNFHSFCTPYGVSLDGGNSISNPPETFMGTCQRLMLQYHEQGSEDRDAMDVKPNSKLLSLEWQDQGGSDSGKDDVFGNYSNNLGSSWSGMVNSYGTSTGNPLV